MGYGLSYTTFRYSELHIGKTAGRVVSVSFRIANTGDRDGDEVPQVYLSALLKSISGVAFPVHSLAAFGRVPLKAGESRIVALQIDQRRLQSWSAKNKRRITARGKRMVSVGASSKDLRLEQIVDID